MTTSSREKQIFKKIKAATDKISDGWLVVDLSPVEVKGVVYDDPVQLKLPRIPFERWAANAYSHRRAEYENISPLGMKMQMDNRDHTDWWIGSQLPLDLTYIDEFELRNIESPTSSQVLAARLNSTAWDLRFAGAAKGGCLYLIKPKKEIVARIKHVKTPADIPQFIETASSWKRSSNSQLFAAVIPHAGIEFDAVIRHAAVIITQIGSKAAHIVKVAREDDVPVVLCPDAYSKFFEYEKIRFAKDSVNRAF